MAKECDNPECGNEFEHVMSPDLSPSDVPQFAVTWYDPDEPVHPEESCVPTTGVYKTERFCSKACLDEYVGSSEIV